MNPIFPLEVHNSGTTGKILRLVSDRTLGYVQFREGSATRAYLGFGDAGDLLTNAIPDLFAIDGVSTALHFAVDSDATKGITIDTNGNVGIGTTTPTATLEVVNPGGQNAISASSNLVGVYGLHDGGGTFPGVWGESNSNSSSATAVRGIITSTSPGASSTGVLGVNKGTGGSGIGVWGRQDGSGYGVYGSTPSGTGVVGKHTSTEGTAPGVGGYTNSLSADAAGVIGVVNSSNPRRSSAGVRGINNGTRRTTFGVFGSHAGEGVGVLGTTVSGQGVHGAATSGVGVIGWIATPDGYAVYAQGDFGGTGAKHFVQPHPTDPAKEIRFVCLEGNESGTYFRGSSRLGNGRAVIEVPEEFRLVSETEGVTVQLTPMGPNAGLWVEAKGLDQIVVRGNGEVDFDYFVNGIRRGYADLELIRENRAYVPETRGVAYGTQYTEAHRRILVENGILNPDFTPNEETAARMGWTLREPESDDLLVLEHEPISGGPGSVNRK